MDWSVLEATVAVAETQGLVGVAAIGPDGAEWEHRGGRLFAAASTVKIPLMIAVYREIDAGRLALDTPYTLTDNDRTPGSGVISHLHTGITLTVADLLYLMIAISDNTATNLLLRMLSMDTARATMTDLGMAHSVFGRPMYGRPARADEGENYATPHEYARVLRAILDGKAASSASCEAMTALLETQQNSRRFARYLPTLAHLRWGSKTGSVSGVVNDVGFVLAPNGRLILAVYTENCPDEWTGEAVIGEIARAAMIATGVVGPLRR